jgi:thiamine transporter ThiT
MKNTRPLTRNLCISAMLLALALLLPFLTGQIPQIGAALSPMHIPVLLCGFVCGWEYGLAMGFIAPLLRSVLFGMPAIFPNGVAMAFELAAYGALSGLLYRALPRRLSSTYLALILSMLGGRAVWGLARWALGLATGVTFTLPMFLAGAFVNAVPGIILHIALIPPVVAALEKAKLISAPPQRCAA